MKIYFSIYGTVKPKEIMAAQVFLKFPEQDPVQDIDQALRTLPAQDAAQDPAQNAHPAKDPAQYVVCPYRRSV